MVASSVTAKAAVPWKLTLQAQRRFCERYEMLPASEVHRRSGSKSRYPGATASRWAQAGRIIGLRTGAGLRSPSFQFDAAGQPRKVMAELIALFGGAADPWALALWMDTPNELLGGRRPSEMIAEDPAGVLAAAKQAVSEPV